MRKLAKKVLPLESHGFILQYIASENLEYSCIGSTNLVEYQEKKMKFDRLPCNNQTNSKKSSKSSNFFSLFCTLFAATPDELILPLMLYHSQSLNPDPLYRD